MAVAFLAVPGKNVASRTYVAVAGVLLAGGVAAVPARPSVAASPPRLQASLVDAGHTHACAVTRTGSVRCWGSNFRGQLGDGTTLGRSVPVEVRAMSDVRSVGAGDHTCALTNAGSISCWGRNSSGELGDGTRFDRRTPVPVGGLPGLVTALAVGLNHTCALTEAATVACWGDNGKGQLGNGTTVDSATPLTVPGLMSIASVASGGGHTCAVTSAGGVKCWGSNKFGQLGTGSPGRSSLTPVDVVGLSSGVSSIALGRDHSCALTTEGAAMCWGIDNHGQLGSVTNCGVFPNWVCPSPTPVDDLSSGVSELAAGPDHTCARISGGALRCWGEGNRGQLGNGGGYSYVPVRVVGFQSGAAGITLGAYHTCAPRAAGEVMCWGENSSGQVGDGTRRRRPTAVPVVAGPSGCVVPKLKGRTVAAAKNLLGRTACSLAPIRRAFSPTVKKGRVIAQRPPSGKELPAGASVRLVISKGMLRKRGG
jgi:alpha-tubulin suppressor-like RCC1 family protein